MTMSRRSWSSWLVLERPSGTRAMSTVVLERSCPPVRGRWVWGCYGGGLPVSVVARQRARRTCVLRPMSGWTTTVAGEHVLACRGGGRSAAVCVQIGAETMSADWGDANVRHLCGCRR